MEPTSTRRSFIRCGSEERSERYCFANNIEYVMRKVEQPFVMIFQHDHHFER